MTENRPELVADSDFERIIQPYSEDTLAAILYTARSRKQKVYVWGNTLMISAVLYQRLLEEGADIEIECLEFADKVEAMCFVCMQQLERKDLNEAYRKYLIGVIYAAEYLRASGENPQSVYRSAVKLAVPLNISAGTVLKYYAYSKAIKTIYEVEPKLADCLLNETVRISHENTLELARIPPENLKHLLAEIESGKLKRITYADMRYESRYNPPKGIKPSKVERSEETDEKLAIRQIPVFDPDAQVSSLALTVPSWASSIRRVTDATDFSKISNAARNRLMRNLSDLRACIDTITQAIEEE